MKRRPARRCLDTRPNKAMEVDRHQLCTATNHEHDVLKATNDVLASSTESIVERTASGVKRSMGERMFDFPDGPTPALITNGPALAPTQKHRGSLEQVFDDPDAVQLNRKNSTERVCD